MRRKGIIKLWILMIFCFFLFDGQSSAQVITADIAGTVTDMENTALPGANVTLQNVDTGFSRSVAADSSGRFHFRSVPTQGRYSLTAEISGFKKQVQTGLQFHPNETYTLSFRLEISPIQETVTVQATAPLVNVKRSTVQQVLTEELIRTVPLIGRNYIQLAHLTPGVTGADFWPSTSGTNYWAMNYYVDGSSNFSKWRSAPRTFYSGYSLETIKEVQILNNQFSVEFGEGMSAINSAVTKSGTNEFHGSALFYDRPGNWDNVDIFTGRKAPFDQQQVGFSLGGPIKKDKLHFFLNYEYRRQRSYFIMLAPQYYGQKAPVKQDEHEIFVKADLQLTAQDYLSVRYSADLFDWEQASGTYSLPGELYSYVTYVHTGNFAWTKTLSENSVNELRAQVASYYDLRKNITQFPDRAAESRAYWLSFGTTNEGFGVLPEMTYELFDKYTLGWKNHFFKFGGFLKYSYAEQIMDWYTKGYYYFLGNPDQYPQPYYFMQYFTLDPSIQIVRSKDLYGAVFFEDEWSVSKKFTLTLGVRYDVEYIFDVIGYTAPPDWNNIQPRLGFAYDLFGNGKSVVRGGFGTFSQQQLTYHFTKGAFYGPEGQVILYLYPGDPLFPTYPNGLPAFPKGAALPARNIWEIDDHLKNPYSIQATFGYQQEILPSLSISADAIYMTIMDGLSDLDANAPASPTGPRTVAAADATRPITPTVNGFRTINHLGNLGRTWYKALNLKIERRAADYNFLLTYTLSKTTDMLNPWSLPPDSRNIEADKGPGSANGDRRHMLSFAFFVNSPFKNILLMGWQLSGVFKTNSPPAATTTYGTDLWGTNLFNARPYGRNNLRTFSYYGLDLGLNRKISVSRAQVELRIELFNVFNWKNYSGMYTSLLRPDLYMKPSSTTPPRRFQLGFHVRF